VGLLLDLRQRRGVRGLDYSWANSVRLQRALAAVDVGYRHVKGLAPTTELRQLQYREDDRQGVGKRNRVALAPEYAQRYTREVLDAFDLGALVAQLPNDLVTALSASSAIRRYAIARLWPHACAPSTACRSRTSARVEPRPPAPGTTPSAQGSPLVLARWRAGGEQRTRRPAR